MRYMKFKYLLFAMLLSSFGVEAQNLDIDILKQINSPVQPGDNSMRFVSNSLNVVFAGVPLGMLATGIAKHDHELILKAYETGGAIVIAEGITFSLKHLSHRERPYIAHPELFTGKSSETDYSFPSGHTSIAFATATSVSLAFPKWYVIIPSFTYASLVGYSRMYLGVHYPSDVFGGAIIGAGSSILTWKLNKLLNKKVAVVKPAN